jgi:hypothetical protein
MNNERIKELKIASKEYVAQNSGTPRVMWMAGAEYADSHPSTETMLDLFWFFEEKGLIDPQLCFDPEHWINTVAKEFFPEFRKQRHENNY